MPYSGRSKPGEVVTAPSSPPDGSTAISPRLAWGVVCLLWITYLANYIDRQVVFSIFPVLRQELQFSDAQLGLIGTVFLWVYSLSMPPAGRLSDILPRHRMVTTSLILWSLSILGMCFSGSVTAFLLWRAMLAITQSLYVPAALGLIGRLHPAVTRSRALGAHATAQILGIVVACWYGGWMAERIGWRSGLLALAAAGIAYALVLLIAFRGLPDLGKEEKRIPAVPADIFRPRCYLALALAFFAFCAVLWMLYAWLADFIYQRYGLSMSESGFTATAYLQTSTGAGILAGSALADWLVKRIRAGRFYVAGLGLLLSSPFAYWTLALDSLTGLKLAAAGFGFFSGMMIANVFAAAYDVMSERNYGLGAGALNMIGGLAGGAAVLLAGIWKESIGIVRLMGWGAAATAASAALMIAVAATRFEREAASINRA